MQRRSRSGAHTPVLCVALMPCGLLQHMCNDCGPGRAYPIEQRVLRGDSYKGQTLIWPLPALLSGEVARGSGTVVWAVGDEWVYLVGRLLQFHTNWGVSAKSKRGNWVTWRCSRSRARLRWPCRPQTGVDNRESYHFLCFIEPSKRRLSPVYWWAHRPEVHRSTSAIFYFTFWECKDLFCLVCFINAHKRAEFSSWHIKRCAEGGHIWKLCKRAAIIECKRPLCLLSSNFQ